MKKKVRGYLYRVIHMESIKWKKRNNFPQVERVSGGIFPRVKITILAVGALSVNFCWKV